MIQMLWETQVYDTTAVTSRQEVHLLIFRITHSGFSIESLGQEK